jgi:hypothetical protein
MRSTTSLTYVQEHIAAAIFCTLIFLFPFGHEPIVLCTQLIMNHGFSTNHNGHIIPVSVQLTINARSLDDADSIYPDTPGLFNSDGLAIHLAAQSDNSDHSRTLAFDSEALLKSNTPPI